MTSDVSLPARFGLFDSCCPVLQRCKLVLKVGDSLRSKRQDHFACCCLPELIAKGVEAPAGAASKRFSWKVKIAKVNAALASASKAPLTFLHTSDVETQGTPKHYQNTSHSRNIHLLRTNVQSIGQSSRLPNGEMDFPVRMLKRQQVHSRVRLVVAERICYQSPLSLEASKIQRKQ